MINAIIFAATVASSFSTYPGFYRANSVIEMTTDKGLIVEIVVRCGRSANGQISAGIMFCSKVEKLYCSSKNRCYNSANQAIADTCNR